VEVQRRVAAGAVVITMSAREGAARASFDERDILACVLGLTPRDFYKSMAANTHPGLWQDVYRPTFEGTALYVKLQISLIDDAVVISFKEL
jgi:motility quorum-sensing regulator/GCU-specific mRNA interferase toxin